MIVEVSEWLPDLPDLNNPGVIRANNVLPGAISYLPINSLETYSTNAMDARCQGGAMGKDEDANTFTFTGNATKLYHIESRAFVDVSKSGGYNTAADGIWSFAVYGSLLMATNYIDNIQAYTMGISTAFADLNTSAPKAGCLGVFSNFVVAGRTFDAIDGAVPHRVRWSAHGDPTSWDVSATTEADYEDLDSSKGWVQAIVGGEYGTIFQERAILRMDYIGSPEIFSIREIEGERGLLAQNAWARVGRLIFYLSLDGFYVTDGNESTPIGESKVNRTFLDDLDQNYLSYISCAADPNKQIVIWIYPNGNASNGVPNKYVAYNYSPNAKLRWSDGDFPNGGVELLFLLLSEGYTVETLDNINTDLDLLPFSLDSRYYTGNAISLVAVNASHEIAAFTGTALDATVEFAEVQLIPNRRAELIRSRPIVDGGTSTFQIGTREKLSESVTWGSSISENTIGEFESRSNARFHRGALGVSGGFNHIQGIEILEFVDAGER